MRKLSDEEISHLAHRFRRAIEQTDRKKLGMSFDTFPRGSCGDVALLLGRFLIESEAGTFQYVMGMKHGPRPGDVSTHAWVARDGLLIDITADQFPEQKNSVVVARGSAWHRKWNPEEKGIADFMQYDSHTRQELQHKYDLIRVHTDAA